MHSIKLTSHQLQHVVNLIADDLDLCTSNLRCPDYSEEELTEYRESIVTGAHVLASIVKGL